MQRCIEQRYRCSMPFRCEHPAAHAQLLVDGELVLDVETVEHTTREKKRIH